MDKDSVQEHPVPAHPATRHQEQQGSEPTPSRGAVAGVASTPESRTSAEQRHTSDQQPASIQENSVPTRQAMPIASQNELQILNLSVEHSEHTENQLSTYMASESAHSSHGSQNSSGAGREASSSRAAGQTQAQMPIPSTSQSHDNTPSTPVPIVNIFPSTPPQNSALETPRPTSGEESSSAGHNQPQPAATSGFISMPAPQPIQPIYYTAAQPLYAMDTSGSSTPSTTSPAGTPSPVQYVHVLPSPSRSGSPLPFVQIINGQPMLVQPLASHIQSVVQSPPPSVAVLQPMPEPLTVMSAPQPIHVHPPSQPASSITTVLDSSGMESSRSEEVPPAVPPKPQASAPVPTPTQQVYVPTRISHSIATQMNAAPSLVQRPGNNPPPDVAQIHSDMPGTFPVTANSTTLPLHIQPQQQQPRRLSWDDTAFAPPSSANGRRAISGSQDRSASSVILNMPPLTGIGSSPYPPLTPTAMDNGRNGNGRDGYFPPYHNGHSHRDSHPPDRDVRPEIRRPQRAHSHAHSARTPRDGYPLDLSRRGTYPMMANSNGQGIINLDDRPGDIERGEHVPSRRNSAYSNQDGRAAGAGARRSNVDLNRAPVENGGLRRSSTGTSENTRTSVNGGGGVLGLMGWLRGRPQLKKETSELVDELSAVSREKSIAERLAPTLRHAEEELKKAQVQAKATGWSLNVAIGAQVILGALTTGVAAATTGRQTSIATSILGGLSTLAASYLAKARGSGEPEASSLRCKDLENFVRDLQNLRLDRGYLSGNEHDEIVQNFRDRFEEIMGNNNTNGLKMMGEFVKDKMKEGYRERVAPHVPVNVQNVNIPGSWQEASERAYRDAEEQERKRVGAGAGGNVGVALGEKREGGQRPRQ